MAAIGARGIFKTKSHFSQRCCFCFRNIRSLTTSKQPQNDKDKMNEETFRHLMLKYSHENGFLSWSRNAAICAGVGASASLLDQSWSPIVNAGFIDLGLLFMSIGSVHHIGASFMHRKSMRLTSFSLLWIIIYTSSIWMFYYWLTQSKIKQRFYTSFE